MGDAATLWHDGARRKYPMPTATRIVNPQYLVETEWLAAHLADPELRVFDCTTYLDPDPVKIFVARSGRPEWEQGHIPGAGHLDLQGELSDASPCPARSSSPRPCRAMVWARAPAWCSTARVASSGRRGSGGCSAPSASTTPPS